MNIDKKCQELNKNWTKIGAKYRQNHSQKNKKNFQNFPQKLEQFQDISQKIPQFCQYTAEISSNLTKFESIIYKLKKLR